MTNVTRNVVLSGLGILFLGGVLWGVGSILEDKLVSTVEEKLVSIKSVKALQGVKDVPPPIAAPNYTISISTGGDGNCAVTVVEPTQPLSNKLNPWPLISADQVGGKSPTLTFQAVDDDYVVTFNGATPIVDGAGKDLMTVPVPKGTKVSNSLKSGLTSCDPNFLCHYQYVVTTKAKPNSCMSNTVTLDTGGVIVRP